LSLRQETKHNQNRNIFGDFPMEIVSCKKLTRAGETIAFVAWVTGTGEAAQGIGTLSEHVTRSILALIFVWKGGEKNKIGASV
jgi:hypothetical protein